MLMLAADHAIGKLDAFHQACATHCPSRRRAPSSPSGSIPTEPATGYGYLKPGHPFPDSKVCKLEAFAEKPDGHG